MADKHRFTIQCYPEKSVAYNHPDHPRHAFPENWDDAGHPRFDFERLENAFERLIAKDYTVHTDARGIEIRSKSGVIMFKMELP